MAKAIDIGLDVDGDLEINNGDLVAVLSDNQHKADILLSATGYFKEFPLCGVNIKRYLNAKGVALNLKLEIKKQLQGDGYSVQNVLVAQAPDGTISIKEDAVRL